MRENIKYKNLLKMLKMKNIKKFKNLLNNGRNC